MTWLSSCDARARDKHARASLALRGVAQCFGHAPRGRSPCAPFLFCPCFATVIAARNETRQWDIFRICSAKVSLCVSRRPQWKTMSMFMFVSYGIQLSFCGLQSPSRPPAKHTTIDDCVPLCASNVPLCHTRQSEAGNPHYISDNLDPDPYPPWRLWAPLNTCACTAHTRKKWPPANTHTHTICYHQYRIAKEQLPLQKRCGGEKGM